VDGIIYFI